MLQPLQLLKRRARKWVACVSPMVLAKPMWTRIHARFANGAGETGHMARVSSMVSAKPMLDEECRHAMHGWTWCNMHAVYFANGDSETHMTHVNNL